MGWLDRWTHPVVKRHRPGGHALAAVDARLLALDAKSNRAEALDYAVESAYAFSISSPKSKDYATYLKAYKLPWVRACVQVIAYNAANIEFKLLGPTRGDDDQPNEVSNSPFLNLMYQPNPFQTGFELRELLWTDQELTGNAFVALEAKTGRGLPTELYRLSPDRVTVIPDPEKMVAGYKYTVNGRSIPYGADEILHLKYPNPLDSLYGMGVIEAAEGRFDSEKAMIEHERRFWQSGAKITGVFKSKEDINETVFNRLKDSIRKFFDGSGYTTLLLGSGLDYQSVSDSPAKLGLLDMAQASRDQILALFGVPTTKLGILERANYKADEADRYFWCFTAGTKIVTDQKSVTIEDVKVGDLVLTHEGRYRPVVEARSREYYGRLFSVSLARHAKPIEVSEEHPFYVQRNGREEWVKVGDLAVGDMVLGRRLSGVAENPRRMVPTTPPNGRGARPMWECEVTPAVGRLIGLYLAEGHLVRSKTTGDPERVDFAFGANEHNLIGEAIEGLTLFGRSSAGQPRRGCVVVHGSRAAAELLQEFGGNAHDKHIPAWLLQAPDDVLVAVLAGYWEGDGMEDRYRLRAGTVSEQLADDLRLALTRFGVIPTMRAVAAYKKVSNGANINASPSWLIELTGQDVHRGRALFGRPSIQMVKSGRPSQTNAVVVDERFVAYCIEAISWRQATGDRIYNMEVAEDHSYTAEGILAHNTETVSPKLTRFENSVQSLIDLFHPGAGYRFEFQRLNFSDDLPQMEVAMKMRDVGIFRANEIRGYLGRDPIPDGDVLISGGMVVPVDLAGAMATLNERRLQQGLPPIEGGDEYIILPARSVPLDVATGTMLQGGQAKPGQPQEPNVISTGRAKATRTSAGLPATGHRVTQRREKAIKRGLQHKAKLETFFGEQEARILRKLALHKRQKASLTTEGVWDADRENEGLLGALDGLYLDAMQEGYGAASDSGLDVAFDLDNPRLADFRGTLAKRVQGINETTRDALDAQITEGLRRGYSVRQMAEGVVDEDYAGVSGVFSEARGSRSEMIARTESLHAFSGASIAAYQQSGVVDMVELMDGTDDPECADRNGRVVPLSQAQEFLKAEHPNGVLALLPVVGG